MYRAVDLECLLVMVSLFSNQNSAPSRENQIPGQHLGKKQEPQREAIME